MSWSDVISDDWISHASLEFQKEIGVFNNKYSDLKLDVSRLSKHQQLAYKRLNPSQQQYVPALEHETPVDEQIRTKVTIFKLIFSLFSPSVITLWMNQTH